MPMRKRCPHCGAEFRAKVRYLTCCDEAIRRREAAIQSAETRFDRYGPMNTRSEGDRISEGFEMLGMSDDDGGDDE